MRLVFVRPFVPFVVRNFSLYWRNKMVDWLPVKPLKDLRRIVDIMDRTSRRIFEQKKAGTPLAYAVPDSTKSEEGDLGGRMKGKDIMSIMRASRHSLQRLRRAEMGKVRANASSSSTETLTDSELIGQMKYVDTIHDCLPVHSTLKNYTALLFLQASKPRLSPSPVSFTFSQVARTFNPDFVSRYVPPKKNTHTHQRT